MAVLVKGALVTTVYGRDMPALYQESTFQFMDFLLDFEVKGTFMVMQGIVTSFTPEGQQHAYNNSRHSANVTPASDSDKDNDMHITYAPTQPSAKKVKAKRKQPAVISRNIDAIAHTPNKLRRPLPDVIETGALGGTHAPPAQSGGICGPAGLLGYSGVGWAHAGGATEWARASAWEIHWDMGRLTSRLPSLHTISRSSAVRGTS
ncbi:MAG: hypothetical protein FRX49_03534 [Trebouxia sp. A1-2]|nr:MAG: hypothetical protein FRX49_03534 [Trebouxia sp. A1-2]